MRFIYTFFCYMILFKSSFAETIFNNKTLSNFYINNQLNSPIIYPLELGHELELIEVSDVWSNVMDNKTGLKGWVLSENFSNEKPKGDFLSSKDFDRSFQIFKEQVLEMSKSIQDAIKIKTFIDVKHIGGAAAYIVADDNWFNGRRHQGQAFQVYDLWKKVNQSPSFLSFKDSNGKERFIILSGPHRPRYLKVED